MSALKRLPPRPADAHKGTMGRVLVIAGSRSYQGAGALCAAAALRGGAGLVHFAFPASLYDCYAARLWEAILHPMPETASGSLAREASAELMELAAGMDSAAVGPGFSLDPSTVELAAELYASLPLKAVFDADGLNALARLKVSLSEHAGPRVLTPHPGELRRLAGEGGEDEARELAASAGVIVVYKTHRPLVTDGGREVRVESGTPALATGGTGDVLTGLAAALLNRLPDPLDAAALAAHLHGRAGALAGEALTEECVTASDLLDYLPAAFMEMSDRER